MVSDNKTIRRDNLLGLIRQFKTIEALASATGTDASYLSQIKNGTREMGDRTARKLERGLKMERGWMDLIQYGSGNRDQQIEALQILRDLSDHDREAWLKHGRLLQRSNKT